MLVPKKVNNYFSLLYSLNYLYNNSSLNISKNKLNKLVKILEDSIPYINNPILKMNLVKLVKN